MKKKAHKQNTSVNGLDGDITVKIVNIVVTVVAVILIGIPVVNLVSSMQDKGSTTELTDVWKKEYMKAEMSKTGIIFNDIETTSETYELLRNSCNEYISSNKASLDAKIKVDTVVGEQVYADSVQEKASNSEDSNEAVIMSETGPVYLNDVILIRYINSLGELKIVTSTVTPDRGIAILNQSELRNYMQKNNGEVDNKVDSSTVVDGSISEEEYLADIGKSIVMLIKASDKKDIAEADKLAVKYFTSVGRNAVIEGRNTVDIKPDSIVDVAVVMAGKSDINRQHKDRVYMQLVVNSSGIESYINIILKLNDNLKIFDIDII